MSKIKGYAKTGLVAVVAVVLVKAIARKFAPQFSALL